jgi:catechol 2,3-dioxygenase-like lactoylglutathione lyase family enzyme
MKYSHTALAVRSIERSRAFYEGIFGLTLKAQKKSEELNATFVQLADEKGVMVELFEHARPSSHDDVPMDFSKLGIKHISFQVEKIEAVLERVKQFGGSVVREIRQGKTVKRNAFAVDPDGIAIELVEI